jgi:hypothetical protein
MRRHLAVYIAIWLSFAGSLDAAVFRYTYTPKDTAPRPPSTRIPQFIVCDRQVELPTSDVGEGDIAYAKDSDKMFKRTTSSWTELGAGGGGGNFVESEIDFGVDGNTNASLVVTGQAWVTGASTIVCAPTMLSTTSRAEGAEDAIIEGLTVAVHSRVAGTGYTLAAAVKEGRAYGKFKVHCTGS